MQLHAGVQKHTSARLHWAGFGQVFDQFTDADIFGLKGQFVSILRF